MVAARFARHDPAGARTRTGAELVSCPGSRLQAPYESARQPSLDGYEAPPFPGQLPLF